MTSYRAEKSGLAAEAQKKIESNFDSPEAIRCLHWIQLMTGCQEIPSDPQSIPGSRDFFYEILHDGMILCRLIDALMPGYINWDDRTYQVPKGGAMKKMRERERIAIFTGLVLAYGVTNTYTFPTESLHETGALNLAQVCVCLRALGMEAQTKADYFGPAGYWPKKAEKNFRDFSDEIMREGQSIISLQYGTNKGANQSGMNIGKQRKIID